MEFKDLSITETGEHLPPIGNVYPETSLPHEKKEPNKFLKVLSDVADRALNIVAPGIGSLVGNLIGRASGSMFGSYGALCEGLSGKSVQRFGLRHRLDERSPEFATVSSLLKTRHESEMTAVSNIKS